MLAQPEHFLTVRAHALVPNGVGASGLCVGYEQRKWRTAQLVSHTMEWLPEFALKGAELEGFRHSTGVALMRKAALRVYETQKFSNRGEFSELFLHIAIR